MTASTLHWHITPGIDGQFGCVNHSGMEPKSAVVIHLRQWYCGVNKRTLGVTIVL